eukprot:m.71768 g.71768  ORF g.71768 m.71768 type:complete len:1159 (+) comp12276_c0_seq1:222-3698(+)
MDNKLVWKENKSMTNIQEQDHSEHKHKVWPNVRWTVAKPARCCARLCCAWVTCIIVLGVLTAAFGGIYFSLDIPFYERDQLNQKRQDAILSAKRDADVLPLINSPDGSICVHDDPTILSRNGTLLAGEMPTPGCQRTTNMYFRVLYVSKDRKSNVLTSENLQEIKKIEDRLLNHIETTRYCYLQDTGILNIDNRTGGFDEVRQKVEDAVANNSNTTRPACKRISSALNYFDDLYYDYATQSGLGTYLISPDIVKMEYNLTKENVEAVTDYWAAYKTSTFDLSDFPVAVATIGKEITVPNLFYYVTSSSFTATSPAIGLISVFDLGTPINEYFSATQEADEQHTATGEWLYQEFDSFLKDSSFEGVDVYWNDDVGAMANAEAGRLALQSFALIIGSITFVLFYFMFMNDSIFLACMGMMQIFLCFIPGILLYRYVFQQEYIGVLNLVAIYIILGIGVDDLFVFCDAWKNHRNVKDREQRYQHTYAHAISAMFTTSCTTFISFISNATSVFPAVSTFGLWSACLVLSNFGAVSIFWPAVHSTYTAYIEKKWWDHPSSFYRCKKFDASNEKEETPGVLERFFDEKWGKWVIQFRRIILLIFVGILVAACVLASGLKPDEEAPTTLPENNNYRKEREILLGYFQRTDNPTAITIQWQQGIDPVYIIDRSGVNPTNVTDYGKTRYASCDKFDPQHKQSQVWLLNTCHDAFFGNVSQYHGGFGIYANGTHGPEARKIIGGQVELSRQQYYRSVKCPMQTFRDYLLTDSACPVLRQLGLECFNETRLRPNCETWAYNNSCEPFPVAKDTFEHLFRAMMFDPTADATTGETNYDRLNDLILIDNSGEDDHGGEDDTDDYSCRTIGNGTEQVIFKAMISEFRLIQDFAQDYEEGIELYEKWEGWSQQMQSLAPDTMKATYQEAKGAWAFYFLNETLLDETFSGIGLALILAFIVLTLVTGNPYMALLTVGTILLIVADVMAFTVIAGYRLGVVEAVNYVVVIGLSIDYCVHMGEAYTEADAEDRINRVRSMVGKMAVSVLSGALSTMGCVFFMFFAPNLFFFKFASFVFVTIALSCLYALVFFPAMLATIGPSGDFGNLYTVLRKWYAKHKEKELDKAVTNRIQANNIFPTENNGNNSQPSRATSRNDPFAPKAAPRIDRIVEIASV